MMPPVACELIYVLPVDQPGTPVPRHYVSSNRGSSAGRLGARERTEVGGEGTGQR